MQQVRMFLHSKKQAMLGIIRPKKGGGEGRRGCEFKSKQELLFDLVEQDEIRM